VKARAPALLCAAICLIIQACSDKDGAADPDPADVSADVAAHDYYGDYKCDTRAHVLNERPDAAGHLFAGGSGYRLRNERIEVAVPSAKGVAMYGLRGGGIVDAVLINEGGTSADGLREFTMAIDMHVPAFTQAQLVPADTCFAGIEYRSEDLLAFPTLAEAQGSSAAKVKVRHGHSLSPGSHVVGIGTTITSNSVRKVDPVLVADVGFWAGDVQLFLPGHGTDDLPVGASTDAYAVTPKRPGTGIPAYAVVAATKLSMINAGGILAFLHPQVDPEKTGGLARWFAIGGGPRNDVAGALAAARAARDDGGDIMKSHGIVRGAVEEAWPGTVLDALDAKGKVIARCDVAKDWSFECPLPTTAVALRPGWIGNGNADAKVASRGMSGGEGQNDPLLTRPIKVVAGETLQILMQACRPARVQVQATDHAGNPLPFRLTLRPVGGKPKAHRRTFVDVDGAGVFVVPPGKYDAWIHHGPFFSQHHEQVEIAELKIVKIAAKLRRVVDTGPWVSADFHVHAEHSSDSDVAAIERLSGANAEGVHYVVATDHDHVTDMGPWRDAAGLKDKLLVASGAEISTVSHGHFNAWPLPIDPHKAGNGSPPWGGMKIDQVFDSILARKPRVVQCNHPRFGGAAVFESLPPATATGDTMRCNAVELINGIGHKDTPEVLTDWFVLLNKGLRPTGTGTSDCHGKSDFPGNPRTLVRIDGFDGGPSGVANLKPAGIDKALLAGRAIATAGPMLQISAASNGESAGIGATAAANGAGFEVKARLRAPAWMKLGQLQVYRNGHKLTDKDVSAAIAKDGAYDIEIALPGPATPAWWVAVHEPPAASSEPGVHRPPWAITNPVFVK